MGLRCWTALASFAAFLQKTALSSVEPRAISLSRSLVTGVSRHAWPGSWICFLFGRFHRRRFFGIVGIIRLGWRFGRRNTALHWVVDEADGMG